MVPNINDMERIIYLDNELGYKFADIKNHQDSLNKETKIAKKGYLVVCVLDVVNNTIVSKCDEFEAHVGFIKSCYPNIALDQQSYSPTREFSLVPAH
jgi:hypothetical protein